MKEDISFPRENRSLVIRGPNEHRLEERDIPVPGPDEVLINVRYVGVCGTDFDILDGSLDYYRSGWARYPIVPGHEFSGVVAAVGNGKEAQAFAVGDKVVGECIMGCGACGPCLRNQPLNCRERKELGVLNADGAYADYVKMPARFVHRLPADAPLEKACLLEPLAVSLRGVHKLVAGDCGDPVNVAVLGCGTIGNLCAQLMAKQGHSVTVFDRNSSRLASAEKKGTIAVSTRIAELGRYEYGIEATGSMGVLERLLGETATGAKILLLGLPYAEMRYNFESLVAFDKTLIGSVGSSRKEFEEAIGVYRGLDLDAFTRIIFPLAGYEEAWDKQRSGEIVKALISTARR